MEIFSLIVGQVLAFLIKFSSGIAFVLAAFFIFRLGFSDEISALLCIAFSDLYWGQWTKK